MMYGHDICVYTGAVYGRIRESYMGIYGCRIWAYIDAIYERRGVASCALAKR